MSRMGLQSQRTADMVFWRGGRLLQLAGGFQGANMVEGHGVVLAALAQLRSHAPERPRSLEWSAASGSDADLMVTSSPEAESSPCELECSGSSEEEPGGMSPAGQQGGLSPSPQGGLPRGQRGGVSPTPLEFESGDMLAMVPRSAPRADLPSAFRWAFTVLEAVRDHVGVDVLVSSILMRAPTVSTHFSGIGTVELASEFLAAAAALVLGTSCRLQFVAACEKSHTCRRILAHMVPGTACIFEDILARAPVAAQLMAEAQTRGMLDFDAAWKKLLQAGLGEVGGKCTQHCCAGCPMPSPLVDVSGSPCTPWSRMGKRAGRGSPLMCLLLTWCLWARAVRPWVLVHENVVGFDVQVFSQCLEDLYEIQVLVVRPAHVGFGFIRRQRLYVVMYLRGMVRPLCGLAGTYERVQAAFRRVEACPPLSACFVAGTADLLAEENRARGCRGLELVSTVSTGGWEYLLTPLQRDYLQDGAASPLLAQPSPYHILPSPHLNLRALDVIQKWGG